MPKSLSGKVVLITGGASGIGAALATQTAQMGADVWIADRQADVAEEHAQRLRADGARAHAIELDVRDSAAFEAAARRVIDSSGSIDYLFNNAGIGIGGEIDTFTVDDWNKIIDVNLRGVINGIQAVYPAMIAQGGGHIVNTASLAGLITMTAQAGYSATKHAVVALSNTLRLEAERHNVKVSVLCPGVVRTPILAGGKYGYNTSASAEDMVALGEKLRPISAEAFADKALRGVMKNKGLVVVPGWWKALWYLERLSPALSMRVAKESLKRTRAVSQVRS
ncbi:SDR family NAD(P)-dependent oxidoreductase [Mycolicibacterium vaccae]|uniref:SDR family NAD(P)-dependent oxidoreductase n=1 Tax=Mycolicibacterium vaccae TaxID=1810 RepID=UPI003CF6B423